MPQASTDTVVIPGDQLDAYVEALAEVEAAPRGPPVAPPIGAVDELPGCSPAPEVVMTTRVMQQVTVSPAVRHPLFTGSLAGALRSP